ncbi:hypothetical protein ES707_17174 [subsurface metagenome]
MQIGTARFTRECPACGKLIVVGTPIAQQAVMGLYQWVHRGCFRLGGLNREIKRLDKEFAGITCEPRELRRRRE